MIEGEIISMTARDVKDGTKVILLIGITDYTSSIYAKLFPKKEEYASAFKQGCHRQQDTCPGLVRI